MTNRRAGASLSWDGEKVRLKASGSVFEVAVSQTQVVLTAGAGNTQFATVNRTGRPVRAAATVQQVQAPLFTLTPPSAEMAPGGPATFTVGITVRRARR